MVASLPTENRMRLFCRLLSTVDPLVFTVFGQLVSLGCHFERANTRPAADVNAAADPHVRVPLAGGSSWRLCRVACQADS